MLGLEPRPPPSPLARVKMKPGEGPPGSPALVQAGFSFRQGLFFFFFQARILVWFFFQARIWMVFFSGTDLLQAGVFSSPVHVCCNTAGSSPWVLKLLGFIPRPQPPNQPLKQGFASLAEVVAGLGGGEGASGDPRKPAGLRKGNC